MLSMFKLSLILYENFNAFEYYGVDEYMGSLGLVVDRRYRGRHIGDQLLIGRKLQCKEFELKLIHSMFTSDFSNKNADRVGFVPNAVIK